MQVLNRNTIRLVEILSRCYSRLGMIDHAMYHQNWDDDGKYYVRILDSLEEIKESDGCSHDLKNAARDLEDAMLSHDYELVDEKVQVIRGAINAMKHKCAGLTFCVQ